MPTTKNPTRRTGSPAVSSVRQARAFATFADFVARRVGAPPHLFRDIRLEAESSLLTWAGTGPLRADGSPRFADWDASAALLALCRRAEVEMLRRRGAEHSRRHRSRNGLARIGAEFRPSSRVFLRAPRSLWRCALDAAARQLALLDAAKAAPRVVFDPAPAVTFADVSRDFLAAVADRALILSGAWARGAAFRADVAKAAADALAAWLARRARFARVDVRAALLARVRRTGERFAAWPVSLVRAVRRAAEIAAGLPVLTVTRQTVGVFA
jgi:hypothetical protein